MIDGAIVSVVPPIVAAVLTYMAVNKRARVQQAKLLSEVQNQAIQQVRIAEEKMRKEIWDELAKVRRENEKLREDIDSQKEEINDLKEQLNAAGHLRETLTQQVNTLESLVNTYKQRIVELEKR